MAVEIKEIVIRAVVADEKGQQTAGNSSPDSHEAMVQECVNQVLKVLQKKNRR